jgi:sirohydrochlorin cobaltochelatase
MMAKLTIRNIREQVAFHTLQVRLRTILPEEYQDSYETLEPVSMGSAALKFDSDGRVAWGEIWDTFCDLAMAGGPPHKGVLLEPGSASEIQEYPDRYRAAVDELTRGIRLASDLSIIGSKRDGWVRVNCVDPAMAEWMLRALIMENISCRWEGASIDVPAGPQFRVEKEIKNVITAIAKTSHYWLGHMWRDQKEEVRKTFAQMATETPLIQPALPGIDCSSEAHDSLYKVMADEIRAKTGLSISSRRYSGWLGVECPSVRGAVWMMRLLAAMNVLARRERTELFVPVNPAADPQGEVVVTALGRVHRFAQTQSIA